MMIRSVWGKVYRERITINRSLCSVVYNNSVRGTANSHTQNLPPRENAHRGGPFAAATAHTHKKHNWLMKNA